MKPQPLTTVLKAEEFFQLKNGGKGSAESVKHNERFSAIYVVNMLEEYANQPSEEAVKELPTIKNAEDFIRGLGWVPEVTVGKDFMAMYVWMRDKALSVLQAYIVALRHEEECNKELRDALAEEKAAIEDLTEKLAIEKHFNSDKEKDLSARLQRANTENKIYFEEIEFLRKGIAEAEKERDEAREALGKANSDLGAIIVNQRNEIRELRVLVQEMGKALERSRSVIKWLQECAQEKGLTLNTQPDTTDLINEVLDKYKTLIQE